jgi:aspartokinase
VYITVPPESIAAALVNIGEELALDHPRHSVERIETVSAVSIIALIGNGVTEADAASLVESSNELQRSGIRVHVIDTAVSHYARCFVVDREHEIRAVRVLHNRMVRPFRPRATEPSRTRHRTVRATDGDKAASRRV